MNPKDNIHTLGIPKSARCPHCGRRKYRTTEQRHNMAECMVNNSAGLWALEHCPHCSWLVKVYPTRINNVPCTPQECDQLTEEIKRYMEANQ